MSKQDAKGWITDIPMNFRIRGGKTVMVLPEGRLTR